MTPPTKSKTATLLQYHLFDDTPAVEELHAIDSKVRAGKTMHRHVIALSGPPASGKSHLVKFLVEKFERNIGVVYPSESLYALMRLCGLPETHLSYKEFKSLPYGRERLITAAARFREIDDDIFSRMSLTQSAWENNDVIIVDNTGFEGELDFFSRVSKSIVLIGLMIPYGVDPKSTLASDHHTAAMRNLTWPGDSRRSLLTYQGSPLKPDQVLAYQDSTAAVKTLSETVFKKNSGLTTGQTATGLYHLRNMLRSCWEVVVDDPPFRNAFKQTGASVKKSLQEANQKK